MKTLIVIPARWKSSRFQGKSLKMILGMTMIERVWNQCKLCKKVSKIIVATDDNRILNFCNKKNINAIMTSKSHLTGSDRISEVARRIKADIYVNVQGDEPLIKPSSIEKLISDFKSRKKNGYESIIGFYKIKKKPKYKNYHPTYLVKNSLNEVLYLSRLPIPFNKKLKKQYMYISLGLFAFTRKGILEFPKLKNSVLEKYENIEMLRFLENGKRIFCTELKEENSSVDYPSDIKKIEDILQKKNK